MSCPVCVGLTTSLCVRFLFLWHARHVACQLTDTTDFVYQSMVRAVYEKPDGPGEGDTAGEQRSIVMYTVLGIKANYDFMYTSGAHPLPVLTPESDRARLALVRALCHGTPTGRGAVVLGDSGGGKSSLVDSTARLLGRHVVAVACTSAALPDSLSALVAGCAAAGCVLRLDDPGALASDALAALTATLSLVFAAITDAKGQATLLNTKLKVAPTFGCVVETTLPSAAGGAFHHGSLQASPWAQFGGGFGRGSGGSLLPLHLAARFRPVHVAPPALESVVQLKLLQEGFLEHVSLAPKVVAAFEALPSVATALPAHSVGSGRKSWGLPALVPFLSAAGAVKRTSPEVAEPKLVIEVMCSLLLPQLRECDQLAATTFLRDLFRCARGDLQGHGAAPQEPQHRAAHGLPAADQKTREQGPSRRDPVASPHRGRWEREGPNPNQGGHT